MGLVDTINQIMKKSVDGEPKPAHLFVTGSIPYWQYASRVFDQKPKDKSYVKMTLKLVRYGRGLVLRLNMMWHKLFHILSATHWIYVRPPPEYNMCEIINLINLKQLHMCEVKAVHALFCLQYRPRFVGPNRILTK